MTAVEIESWVQLLHKFDSLPSYELKRTFMQLSGYPHYENVCSNILGFFFDPTNEHGLKDLCYQALLKCVYNHEVDIAEAPTIEVEREVNCDGKRLDLVLESAEYVVGIENKVWHVLNNDLNIYKKEIDKRAKAKNLKPLYIVLGIREEKPMADFQSVTYKQFFYELKASLGYYAIRAESKYLIYLYDFIQSIEDLQGVNMANETLAQFFKDNYQTINKLNLEYDKYQKTLNNKVFELKGYLEPSTNKDLMKIWIYSKSVLVFDFLFPTGNISIDLAITPAGWEGTLFPRGTKNQVTFEALLRYIGMTGLKSVGKRKLCLEADLDINLEELQKKLETINQKILNYMKTLI